MTFDYFVRPDYCSKGGYAVYHSIGINRAEIVFQGTREECQEECNRLYEEYVKSI